MPEHSPLVVLPSGRATWAVAAIFGESARLALLHARLSERIAPTDHLVYLGNLIGRGRDTIGTIEELLLFRRWLMARRIENASDQAGMIVYLRGCQEEMWHKLLQLHFAPNPSEIVAWVLAQGLAPVLAGYGSSDADGRAAAKRGAVALSQWTNRLRQAMRAADGHDQLFASLRRAAHTEDRRLLCVSAGVDADRPLDRQRDAFWWGGFERLKGGFEDFRRVVRGTDFQHRGVMVNDYAVSIDGGCGFGGPLVAARFDADAAVTDIIEA